MFQGYCRGPRMLTALSAIILAALIGLLSTTVSAAPISINSVSDLENIGADLSGDYVLGSDIDASVTASWNSGSGFIPIGNITTPFLGSLDGRDHTISGLTVNSAGAFAIGGLFEVIGPGALVQNIGLTNVSMTATAIDSVGAITGYNDGTIAHSYVTGIVNGGMLLNSGPAGGLVGFNQIGSKITQSYSNVSVSCGAFCVAGGLTGLNYGTITGSYATGSVDGEFRLVVLGGSLGRTTAPLSIAMPPAQSPGFLMLVRGHLEG